MPDAESRRALIEELTGFPAVTPELVQGTPEKAISGAGICSRSRTLRWRRSATASFEAFRAENGAISS